MSNRELNSIADDDPATAPEASVTPEVDRCPTCKRNIDGELSEVDARAAISSIAMKLYCICANSRNFELTVKCLPFAFGLPITDGRSEASVAKELRKSRSYVNKEVLRLQSFLKARQNRNNLSEKARQTYRKVANERHWRKASPAEAAKAAIRRAQQGNANGQCAAVRASADL